MANPSTADATLDDPTIRRVRHFSAKVACGRFLVVNVWGWRATQPSDLWAALQRGEYTEAMRSANLDAIAAAGAQADALFVAFGAEPWRKHRAAVDDAVRALVWSNDCLVPDCLGLTRDGAPRHPLYVANDCQPFEWPGVLAL